MADLKISQLQAHTSPIDNDLLAIVDTVVGETKKTTINELLTSTAATSVLEPSLPATPVDPQNKYLNGNKQWSEILVGSGGYASNLYLTEINSSDVTGYKQLSYSNDVAEVVKSGTANNNEVLIEEYLFEQAVGITSIDSGAWRAHLYGGIDAAAGDSWFKFEVFKRDTGGTETVLFSTYSQLIENRIGTEGYQRIVIESVQPAFTITATDRLGVKIYAKTTALGDRILYYKVGDGDASYVTSPLALRHSQLRGLNDDTNYLHVTSAEKTTWGGKIDKSIVNAKGDILTATADDTPTRLAVGTDGQVLTADSNESTGLKYTTPLSASSTDTLTNKRINPRLVTAASYTTDTGTSLDVSTCDQFEITAQAGALKFNNPSGTPVGGQKLIIRIKDNGTARALTYDTQFRAMGNALPSTTVVSKTLYMGFIWNATDSKFDLVAVAQES